MYGVIDIGSNTIRLVIYKIDNGKLVPMINKKCSVGLAGYISEDNRLKKIGIEKAIEALNEFREIISYVQVQEIYPFATASIRNITNSKEVIVELKEKTGFDIRIFSGDEEAVFDYYGTLQSVDIESGLMIDVGGGSTELVFFERRKVVYTKSLPIGSLNLYKKYVEGLIPTKKERKKIKHAVKALLSDLVLPDLKLSLELICGVGGTARATQKLLKEMNLLYTDEYSCSLLTELIDILKKDSESFYRQLLKSSPDRIHTFTPGLMVMNVIAKFYGSETVITSKYGVREGYLYYLLEEKGVIKNDIRFI